MRRELEPVQNLLSRDEAAAFLNWLPTDPREYTDAELETQYCVFREKRIPE